MNIQTKPRRQAGFSLIELMLVVMLLSIVVGALFSQINRAQVRYKAEDQKLDQTQQEREFIDQFTRDLHQSGYPASSMFGGATGNQTAAGVIAFSSTDVQMEGDVDGDGVVDVVEYSYASGTITRTVKTKGSATATSSTEVQGVLTTDQNIFTAYDKNGNTTTDVTAMKTVRIILTTQSAGLDNDLHKSIQVTMTGIARLVNQ